MAEPCEHVAVVQGVETAGGYTETIMVLNSLALEIVVRYSTLCLQTWRSCHDSTSLWEPQLAKGDFACTLLQMAVPSLNSIGLYPSLTLPTPCLGRSRHLTLDLQSKVRANSDARRVRSRQTLVQGFSIC